jgi:predicted nucleotidyltransferase
VANLSRKMEKLSSERKIIILLFKDRSNMHNSRSVSKIIGISHPGSFKIMKKLERRGIVTSRRVGKAVIYSLNMENNLALREIELALTIEAQGHGKWLEELDELKNKVKIGILFGSVIRNEKNAKDIDLYVAAEKSDFPAIQRIIKKKNEILAKKVHLLLQTVDDLKKDLEKGNKAIDEIIKTGIVLFGQENITRVIK